MVARISAPPPLARSISSRTSAFHVSAPSSACTCGVQRRPKRGSGSISTKLRPGTASRSARVYSMREGDLGQLGGQELGGVAARHGHLPLLHLVIEVDARGAPHHDLARRVALEVFDGAQVDIF